MDDKTKTVTCPECQNPVDVSHEVRVGDVLECPHCGSELRIIAFDTDENALVNVIEEEK